MRRRSPGFSGHLQTKQLTPLETVRFLQQCLSRRVLTPFHLPQSLLESVHRTAGNRDVAERRAGHGYKRISSPFASSAAGTARFSPAQGTGSSDQARSATVGCGSRSPRGESEGSPCTCRHTSDLARSVGHLLARDSATGKHKSEKGRDSSVHLLFTWYCS